MEAMVGSVAEAVGDPQGAGGPVIPTARPKRKGLSALSGLEGARGAAVLWRVRSRSRDCLGMGCVA